ncbi:MAG: type II toxin-antitoxin system RatA family toxin [Bradyrhizobium sp.]
MSERVDRIQPYSPEQLFDLAADVERYPEFLRWWVAARVRKREAEVYYTDQVLGLGPIRLEFESRTVLCRPERIDVTSNGPPFRKFKLSWLFDSRPGGRCRVTLIAEMEFRSHLLERLVDKAAAAGMNDIIDSFVARARRLYEAKDRPIENASRK